MQVQSSEVHMDQDIDLPVEVEVEWGGWFMTTERAFSNLGHDSDTMEL